jgi:hypothetical protein
MCFRDPHPTFGQKILCDGFTHICTRSRILTKNREKSVSNRGEKKTPGLSSENPPAPTFGQEFGQKAFSHGFHEFSRKKQRKISANLCQSVAKKKMSELSSEHRAGMIDLRLRFMYTDMASLGCSNRNNTEHRRKQWTMQLIKAGA